MPKSTWPAAPRDAKDGKTGHANVGLIGRAVTIQGRHRSAKRTTKRHATVGIPLADEPKESEGSAGCGCTRGHPVSAPTPLSKAPFPGNAGTKASCAEKPRAMPRSL